MLKNSCWRKGQECAHSWHKNHPLGFIGRGKVSAQMLWSGMGARIRKNDGTLEAPSVQAIDADGTYEDRQGIKRTAVLNRLRFGRDGGKVEGQRKNEPLKSEAAHHASWSKAGVAVDSGDDITAVGLTLNKLVSDGTPAWRYIFQSQGSVPAGEHVVLSVHIQDGTEPDTAIRVQDLTAAHRVSVPITWSAGGVPTAQGHQEGGDFKWIDTIIVPQADGITYRIILIVKNNNVGALDVRWLYYNRWDDAGGIGDYTYAGGFMGEIQAAPVASSYIYTATSGVTRAADNVRYSTTDVLDFTGALTIVFAMISDLVSVSYRLWSAMDAFDDNRVEVIHNADNTITLFVRDDAVGASAQATTSGTVLRRAPSIIVVTKAADGAMQVFLKGVLDGSHAGLAPNGTPSTFRIGGDAETAGREMYGALRNMTIIAPVLSIRQAENVDAVIRRAA